MVWKILLIFYLGSLLPIYLNNHHLLHLLYFELILVLLHVHIIFKSRYPQHGSFTTLNYEWVVETNYLIFLIFYDSSQLFLISLSPLARLKVVLQLYLIGSILNNWVMNLRGFLSMLILESNFIHSNLNCVVKLSILYLLFSF